MRLPDKPGMQTQGQQAAAGPRGLGAEQIAGIADLLDPGVFRVQIVLQHEAIFDFRGQRQRRQPPLRRLERVGQIVVDPVAQVGHAVLGEKLRRVLALVAAGAEPARDRLPARGAQRRQAALDQIGLNAWVHAAVMRAIHVPAVADDLTLAGGDLDQQRRALGELGVNGEAGAQVALRQGVKDPIDTYPVAVVAQGVVAQIGIGHAHTARRREGQALLIEREILHTDVDPQRQAGAAGPAQRWAFA